MPLRQVATGILYVLRTGCQWKAMPAEFGSGSAIHAYFQEWVESGVFHQLWRLALEEYDDLVGIDWEWQSLDGAMTKAPLGGEKKLGKTPRIVASGELNVRYSPTQRESRWASRLRAPMCMTKCWSLAR